LDEEQVVALSTISFIIPIEDTFAVNGDPRFVGTVMRFAIAGQMKVDAIAQIWSDKGLDSRFES
jgi:hypothetical protein